MVVNDGVGTKSCGVKMNTFEINYSSTHCVEWPKIKVIHNGKIISDIVCDGDKFNFDIIPEEKNVIALNWYNKTQRHTKAVEGKIFQDQTFKMGILRADGILLENWFFTDGYYEPRYFKGYVEAHKQNRTNTPLETRLPSQNVWHFPGIYYLKEWQGDFWDWYYDTKIGKEVVQFTDKDPERIAKYRGTLDPCTDLVGKLKELIK